MKALKLHIKNFLRIINSNYTGNHRGNSVDTNKTFPIDFEQDDISTILSIQKYTMTSPERIFALIQAVNYVVKNNIPGDIVECGVWKGGSMMAVAQRLNKLGDHSRRLYLFDTFEGMTEPTEKDVVFYGADAITLLKESKKEDENSIWCYSPFQEVKNNLYSVGYENEKIHFIQGRVEQTIPNNAPEVISILRLDTDWYESTRHELVHLFPRLSSGGVLIIDDYGWWKGARQATDEYIQENNIKILLNRIDYTGRIGIKL
jgi:predicted O-methyltransferase YrrM